MALTRVKWFLDACLCVCVWVGVCLLMCKPCSAALRSGYHGVRESYLLSEPRGNFYRPFESPQQTRLCSQDARARRSVRRVRILLRLELFHTLVLLELCMSV